MRGWLVSTGTFLFHGGVMCQFMPAGIVIRYSAMMEGLQTMIYEIINPSDKVMIEADNFLIAAAAVLLLGRGRYGLRKVYPKDGDERFVPVLIFGGDEWIDDVYGKDGFEHYWESNCIAIAKTMRSRFYGTAEELLQFHKDTLNMPLNEKMKLRKEIDRKQRTSYNNIGLQADLTADALEKHTGTSDHD